MFLRGGLKTGENTPAIFGVALILCVITPLFSGCLDQGKGPDESPLLTPDDQPCILPDWKDGDYHDYQGTTHKLQNFNTKYPNLVSIFSIGKSVQDRDIWCIRVTNEYNNSHKFSCLIDGCIHGYEWEAGEACLYLAEYLLINFGTNRTTTHILNSTEVYIVPLLNPDGRENNDRFNDNGVDLNRNFDVFFGKIRGHSLRLGKLFGKIKIPVIKIPPDDPFKWYWNCGKYAFSEPETQAISTFMKELYTHGFSFYVNCHTALHNIVTPWITYKPPFEMTQQEKNVFDYVVDWVIENTEYEAFRVEGFKTGGCAMDWCFKEFRIPSFTFELYPEKYDPCLGSGEHVDLIHWMNTTLPFFMYLFVNIENLHQWELPCNEPLLPDGVPPAPLK